MDRDHNHYSLNLDTPKSRYGTKRRADRKYSHTRAPDPDAPRSSKVVEMKFKKFKSPKSAALKAKIKQ